MKTGSDRPSRRKPVFMTTPSLASPTPLDLRGLKCPLPALRVRKALGTARPGDLLVVTCTDPMAAIDIPSLMREAGASIEHSAAEGELLVFHIRKAAA
jgi:tRNA 2-thiouridine synthesizing protein A